MAKKKTKKQNKEIKEKPTQKIKEKTSNKVEVMEKNPQIKDLEIEEKPPQKIKIKMPEKESENIEVIPEEPQAEIKEDELVKVLKIPMQEAAKEETTNPVKEALFSSDQSPEPEFEEEEEEETENLNDKYFDDDSTDDDLDSTFFEDEELMAEMGVEIIDLGMSTMAQAIAQDFDNPKKYAVSDYKKNKIKKPLRLLLQKRGVKVSPEIMFGVTLLVIYVPIMVLAVQERKAKRNARKTPPKDVAEEIPENIQSVNAEDIRQKHQPPPTPPIPEVKKKGGRPKGSKDKKPRKTDGYKGNTNSQ